MARLNVSPADQLTVLVQFPRLSIGGAAGRILDGIPVDTVLIVDRIRPNGDVELIVPGGAYRVVLHPSNLNTRKFQKLA